MPSVSDVQTVSHHSVCAEMATILRIAQARGFTDEKLERLSGVRARTIKSWRNDGKEPSLSAAFSIAKALGDWAVNRLLAVIGYAAKPIGQAEGDNINLAVASMIGNLTTIATCAADGRIDHLEAPTCDKAAAEIVATAARFREPAMAC